jgi:RHS repeat-associated protein
VSGSENPQNVPIDSNGNLCSEGGTTCTNGTKTYVWDAENRLVEVKQGATTLASFAYNAGGIRTRKTAGGVTTTYVLEGVDVVEERLSTGGTIRYFTDPGIENLVATQDATGVVTYNVHDHLGSVRQSTDSAGQLVLTRDYDPWGAPLLGVSASGSSFTGREWDPQTQLYYLRARYYGPTVGRFLSEDILAADPAFGLGAYCGNNPVRYIDPLGLAHAPGGPWHPEAPYDKVRCYRSDSCPTLASKISRLSNMIRTHRNWDIKHGTDRHAKDDLPGMINAITRCGRIYKEQCPQPQNDCTPRWQDVVDVLLLITIIIMMFRGGAPGRGPAPVLDPVIA